MQSITEPVQNFKESGEEAERLQVRLHEVNSEIQTLSLSMTNLHKVIKTSDVKQDPRVRRLICELNLLKPYITQSKNDIQDIRSDISGLLYCMDKALSDGNCRDEMDSATAQIELDAAEVDVDTEDCDDCDSHTSSTVRSALKVIPHIGSINEQSESVTQASKETAQSNQIFMKPNQSSDDCIPNACAKNLLYDVSLKRLNDAKGSENLSKILFTCHLCGAVTDNANNHMKEIHLDEKFQCQDCGKVFDDFENMCHHKEFHKQEKELNCPKSKENKIKDSKRSNEQSQTGSFNSNITPTTIQCDVCGRKLKTQRSLTRHMHMVHKITPMPVPPCDVCGEEFKNFSLLKKHKFSTHSTEKPWKCEVCNKSFRWKKDSLLCKHSNRKLKPGRIFRCYVCGEEFTKKRRQRIHLRMVHDLPKAQRFPCLICDETFSQIQELRDHLPLHSVESNETLKCKLCERDFNDPSSLRKHLLRHNNMTHSCEICGKDSMTIGTFRRHMAFHSQHISCHVCGRVMSSASRLKEHMNVHTGDKPIECNVCHKKLSSTSALKNHKNRLHSNNNRGMRCEICGKLFKTPFARNTHHLIKHTEEERKQHDVVVKMFTCHICGKTVRNEYKNSHLNKHSNKSEILHVCEICGKGFIRLSLLTVHMMEHKIEQGDAFLTQVEKEILDTSLQFEKEYELKHACDFCGKKFRLMSSLAYHKKGHNNEMPHRCAVCGRGFKSVHGLKLHERKSHYRDEPFTCEICGRKFQRKILLQSHMTSHSGVKTFSCPICGTKFKSDKNITRHIKLVHNRERRFTCDVCGKGFGTKIVLKVHYRKHTGEKPHTCDTCGRSFSDPSTLVKHNMLHKKKASNLLIASDTDQPSVQSTF